MRIYDPRLGRFLSVDPLTKSYPMLTPYQYATNRPIDGVDLDGLEWTKADVIRLKEQAKSFLKKISSEEGLIFTQGAGNALANANSFGLSDNLPTWTGLSTDNLGDYDNEYHQQIYLWGRLFGDIGALVQSADEVGGGLTTAAAGAGTGVVAAGGLIVAGHGAGVGGAAIYDANWTLGKLKDLGVQVNASSNASSSTESAANNQTNTAHGNSNASASNSAKPQKGEYKPTGGHHVHSKAGFKDNMNYDSDKGFSISQAFMKEKGWNHSKMTTKQRELFKELWQSGRANTIEEHSRIAVEALRAGGAPEAEARSLVGESLLNLRGQNATTPTNIPWYR